MRILLTGASGQIGGALLPRLQQHGVTVVDRTELDLAQPEKIGKVLDRLAPDIIINPAAYTAVDKAEDERELAMVVNARAPEALARWARPRNVPLVHFSTDYVFDGKGERPLREDDATEPLSIYGTSKLAGEAAIRTTGGTFLIVRTSWVYAATGTNFLRTIARLARERSELRVVADQFGAPTSAALIADVVAGWMAEDLDIFRARCARVNGLVHLTASGETSWHGFAVAIVDGLKERGVALEVDRICPIKSAEYPTRAKRPRNSRLDLTRLREAFGISPPDWRIALIPELDRIANELRKLETC